MPIVRLVRRVRLVRYCRCGQAACTCELTIAQADIARHSHLRGQYIEARTSMWWSGA